MVVMVMLVVLMKVVLMVLMMTYRGDLCLAIPSQGPCR